MNDRWPFCFKLADVEISGALMPAIPPGTADSAPSFNPRAYGPQKVASDRVPGVWLVHTPTGHQTVSTMRPTREENLTLALRRLHIQIERGLPSGPR